MDSLIAAAARALASGDPLGALNRIALRNDAPALALRGIAMAQLGDLARARTLLRSAARAFGPKEAVAHARCVVAEADVALASRDLSWRPKALDAARATLEAHGDKVNAAHARHLEVRRLALIGRLDEAERKLTSSEPAALPPASRAVGDLIRAGIAMRRLKTKTAEAALARAEKAARASSIAALSAEVATARRELRAPAARLLSRGDDRPVTLADVEALLKTNTLIIDACRRIVRCGPTIVSLIKRPVLFSLALTLAEAWPGDASRSRLLAQAFGAKFTDESHRARLRVEIGRLRAALQPIAKIDATKDGFMLTPHNAPDVVVLAPAVAENHGMVLAFLADGEAWSTSALSLALSLSQRSVQRALDELAAAGKVQAHGRGRARRWTAPPVGGITTALLLPAPLPGG
jgi:hypothetical protein